MTNTTQIPASELTRIADEAFARSLEIYPVPEHDDQDSAPNSIRRAAFRTGANWSGIREYLRREREREELVDALRNLADLQNGPPLEQHKAEWTDAINNAYSVLKKYERSEPSSEHERI